MWLLSLPMRDFVGRVSLQRKRHTLRVKQINKCFESNIKQLSEEGIVTLLRTCVCRRIYFWDTLNRSGLKYREVC